MPICMSKQQWSRIVKWTDPNQEDPAAIRHRELVAYMDKASQAMTKEWPNSFENVNKRNEENRRARIEAAERANALFYQEYVRRKQQEQRKLMHSARDTVFKNKDAPKLLLSAVIESATQKEIAAQREFNQMLREKALEQKRKDDAEIIRRAQEWQQLQGSRVKKRWEINKQHQKEILQQAQEVAERKRKEYETELNCQKIDNQRADEEMKLIKEYEEKLKAEEKKRIFQSMEEAHSELVARRREIEARDKMDDRLIEVLKRSKCRVEQMTKDTEKRMKAEKLRILEEITTKLVSGDEERAAQEKKNLEKACQQKDEIDKRRAQEEEEKKTRLVAERRQQHSQFLQSEQQRLHHLNTMKQWQMINRFKNEEIYEEFKQKERDDNMKKIQQYRDEILRLCKEREDRDASHKADNRDFYGKMAEEKLRDADNKLLTYADTLIQEAIQHGRPPLPIYKAIHRYCKLYGVQPNAKLYKSLQQHFTSNQPKDTSVHVPAHCDPTPPTSHNELVQLDDKRDGLQEPKAGPPLPPPKPVNVDYRHAAPANGLQQRNDIQYVLPPITVIPCQLVQATPYAEIQQEQCRCIDEQKESPKENSLKKSPKGKSPKEKSPKGKSS